jgi:hypothetical protein
LQNLLYEVVSDVTIVGGQSHFTGIAHPLFGTLDFWHAHGNPTYMKQTNTIFMTQHSKSN